MKIERRRTKTSRQGKSEVIYIENSPISEVSKTCETRTVERLEFLSVVARHREVELEVMLDLLRRETKKVEKWIVQNQLSSRLVARTTKQ